MACHTNFSLCYEERKNQCVLCFSFEFPQNSSGWEPGQNGSACGVTSNFNVWFYSFEQSAIVYVKLFIG